MVPMLQRGRAHDLAGMPMEFVMTDTLAQALPRPEMRERVPDTRGRAPPGQRRGLTITSRPTAPARTNRRQ